MRTTTTPGDVLDSAQPLSRTERSEMAMNRRPQPSAAMANTLLVVGGQQRSPRPLRAGTQGWYRYKKGLVVRVDLLGQRVNPVFEHVSPAEVCPPHNPAILFKSASAHGDTLYLCSQTEVLICRLPDFEVVHYITLPQFHDVHHVRPTPRGNLLVVNTGLDMVMEMTVEGEVVREWSVTEENVWDRFSRSVDYRKVGSMKPYRAHPNHVFCVGEEIWVTRFQQRDAICLTDPEKRIEIGLERVHDGVVHDGRIYFTTVDAKIVIVDQATLRVEEVFDLNVAASDGTLLGWCRGLYIENQKAWVGFSRLRPTKFRENVSWVTKGFKTILPTRIGCYDLSTRECLEVVDLEPFGLNAVFSVLPCYS